MVLGTSKTVTNIALAVIPPGNVLASISEFRRSLFSTYGAPSARSFFDFPVLAWAEANPGGAILATLADSLEVSLEFSRIIFRDDGYYLAFSDAFRQSVSQMSLPDATEWSDEPEPFAAGFGVYCASASEIAPEQRDAVLDKGARLVSTGGLRASTYLLAAVELVWSDGGGSSWATLGSARAGEKHRRVPRKS